MTSFSRFLISSKLAFVLMLAVVSTASADSEPSPTLLFDSNGDGQVNIIAFGDSITRGDGDFTTPGERIFQAETPAGEAGYPLRIETWLHIPVANRGVPGDAWFAEGLDRFIETMKSVRADAVVIGNGSNDARRFIDSKDIYHDVQTAINVARASGVTPVLLSIIPACCGHEFLNGSINLYNGSLYLLAAVNEIRLADVAKAFANTCDVTDCHLLARPEGLHPNEVGYDVMGETVAATLLGIDILAADGPTLLAQALGVDPTTIHTVPNSTTETP